MRDMVNHPQHYAEHYEHEVIELTELLSFCLGNAVKYLLRAPYKGGEKEDLQKAEWYLRRMAATFSAEECKAQIVRRPDNFSSLLFSFRHPLVTEIVLACDHGDKPALYACLIHLGKTIRSLKEVSHPRGFTGGHDMTTWHPYPDVPLPKTEFWQLYLVTAVPVFGDNKKPYVRMAYGRCDFWGYEREFTVIAWAELPAPYQKAETGSEA